jgi:lipopolysaccharide transport system permease protein
MTGQERLALAAGAGRLVASPPSELSPPLVPQRAASTAPVGAEVEHAAGRFAFAEIREVVGDLVRYRGLVVELTLRDIRVRYKQAIMGFAWAALTPLAVVLSGSIVRLALASASGRSFDETGLAGIAIKSLGWAFFAGAIGFGASSITTSLPLVTKVYFPREVLPLAAVLTQAVDAAVALLALLIALPPLGVRASPTLLWVPPLALLLVLLAVGAALLLSCANVFFRDARHLVQLLLSFGIFFTPVFFDADMLGARGARLIMLNPLAPILEGMRLAVVQRHDLLAPLTTPASGALAWSPWYLAYAAVWAIGGLTLSAVVFHRSERLFAEYV